MRGSDIKTDCGVYKIIWDKPTSNGGRALGHYYIGSTGRSFYIRWGEHMKAFREGTHYNKYLQTMYDKYGMPSFKILVKTKKEEALDIEQEVLDYHFSMKDRFPQDFGTFMNSSRSATGKDVVFSSWEKEGDKELGFADASDRRNKVAWSVTYPSGRTVIYTTLDKAYRAFKDYWETKFEVTFEMFRDRMLGIKPWGGKGFSGGEVLLGD